MAPTAKAKRTVDPASANHTVAKGDQHSRGVSLTGDPSPEHCLRDAACCAEPVGGRPEERSEEVREGSKVGQPGREEAFAEAVLHA